MCNVSKAEEQFLEDLRLRDVSDAYLIAAILDDFKMQRLVSLLSQSEGKTPGTTYRQPVGVDFRVDIDTRLVDLLQDPQIICGHWRYKNPGEKKVQKINIRWVGRTIRDAIHILSTEGRVDTNDLTVQDLLSVTSSKLLAIPGVHPQDIDKLNAWLTDMSFKPLRRC